MDGSTLPDTIAVGKSEAAVKASGGQSYRKRGVRPFHVDMGGAQHRGLVGIIVGSVLCVAMVLWKKPSDNTQ